MKNFVPKYFLFIFVSLFFLLSSSSLYAQVLLEATVDKPTLTLDDQVLLTVKIKGGASASEPKIPSKGNFQALSQNVSQQIEMVNGRMSIQKEYSYLLQPLKEGRYEIGPIHVTVEGVDYSTAAIVVNVEKSSSANSGNAANNSTQSFGNSNPLVQNNNSNRDVFVEASFNKSSVVLGEQVIYSFKLYSTRNMRNVQPPEFPDFHDFWSETLLKEAKSEVMLGGRKYLLYQFSFALFPTKTGKISLGPTSLKAEVEELQNNMGNIWNDPFFGFRQGFSGFYKPKVLRTNEVELEVRDLPASHEADFKGLVGEYNLKSEISKSNLSVGETSTLTLTLSGEGNLREAQLDSLDNLPNLKIYPDKPQLDLTRLVSGLRSVKTFKLALVPQAPGKIEIPEFKFVVFNPTKQQYEVLKSPAYTLSVVPALGSNTAVAKSGEEINPDPNSSDDLAALHVQLRPHKSLSPLVYKFVFSISLILPLLFVFLNWKRKREQWLEQNESYLRQKRALVTALNEIKKLQTQHSKPLLKDYADSLLKIFKEYLGDKLQRIGVSLTATEIESILKEKKIRTDVLNECVSFISQLEACSFGALSQESQWKELWPVKLSKILKPLNKLIDKA